jgi:phosphoribosylformylglycinamidine cyclo-ligase
MSNASYAAAGVDTAAGDLAVELMKSAVARTHGPEVQGGVGGFAGLYDVSFLTSYRKPLLATSTDGVGTKVAIAQALDKHDTIGQDLVGMVVDDIVVVGARPLFMTDYIACGPGRTGTHRRDRRGHRPRLRHHRNRPRRRRNG